MAVLGRLLLGSAERIDLPDLLSIDSYTASDFKFLIQSMIGSDSPYILKGLDVIQPQDAIGTESISIRIADSVVYYPQSLAGSFFYGLQEGHPSAQPLVPELRKNAINYVYAVFDTFDTARDSRAFWDPDQDGGEGGEFSQDVNTESVLTVNINVSVSTFPEGTIPICKVVVGPSVIESIQDSRPMMFRLGTGGINPNPFYNHNFRNDPLPANARNEPATLMTSAGDPNPFQGGDKNIYTLKEWMNVVMTVLKEITGGTYWYQTVAGSSGPVNIGDIWNDALGSNLYSKGEWTHDELVGGEVSWSEDLIDQHLTDLREIVIRPSTVNIDDGQVAYVELERNKDLNNANAPVIWQNGSNVVNGDIGAFANVSKGDWVKRKSDLDIYYLRVEEFYADVNLTGGAVTPALARSIRLSGNYAGITGTDLGTYSKGEYTALDVRIEERNDQDINDIGGNFYWLAYRKDTVLNIEGITPTNILVDITDAAGARVRCDSTNHGLIDGDWITISSGLYDGTYKVSVETDDIFYIDTDYVADSLGQNAFYAIVETAARSTPYSFQIESANHRFKSDQTIHIENTSTSYDSAYQINVRSDTTFQIAIPSLIPILGNASGGVVRLARVDVRTTFGAINIVQGETIDIGDVDTTNILSYIGMQSITQTKPVYNLPPNYNTLFGTENFNSNDDDNLTLRVSKLTSMMADRVQDRGMSIRGRVLISNVPNGMNQDVYANGSLTLYKSGSPEQIIDLTTTVSLPVNHVAVANIDRNSANTITLTAESVGSPNLLDENKIILFYRFASSTVYNWEGVALNSHARLNTENPEDAQSKNILFVNPSRAYLDLATNEVILYLDSFPQTTDIKTIDASLMLQSSYFNLYSANDVTEYYVWYSIDAGGIDPSIVGKTGILVDILSTDNAEAIASKTVTAIDTAAAADFNVSSFQDIVTIENTTNGMTTATSNGAIGTGFNIQTIAPGLDNYAEILIPGSQRNRIDIDAISALTLTMLDGQSAWVRVDRYNEKIINTISYVNDTDTPANGMLFVTNTSDVPIDQDVVVLFSRFNANIVEHHKAETPKINIYQEYIEVVDSAPTGNEIEGPVPATTPILLPPDSRGVLTASRRYPVGKGHLVVTLNGQVLTQDEDWEEIGATGSFSNRIRMLYQLEVGDIIGFRIDNEGSSFVAGGSGSGGSGSLQDAYEEGRHITTTAGQPVTISGANEALTIAGDVTINGALKFRLNTRTETANTSTTVNDDLILIDATSGIITVSLPVAATVPGKKIHIKKIDSSVNTVDIEANGAETIDGLNTISISVQYQSYSVVSDGTEWWIV